MRSGPVLEISDDDDDDDSRPHSQEPFVDAARDAPSSSSAKELVVFRVPHKHPHMLKRPLQNVDALGFSDLAIRLYTVHEFVPSNFRGCGVGIGENVTCRVDLSLLRKQDQFHCRTFHSDSDGWLLESFP